MDLRDYLRLIRRGWPTLALVTVLCLGVALAYLMVAPKRYEAMTSLLATVDRPSSVGEALNGAQAAASLVGTWAGVIDSAVVVGPAAQDLTPQLPTADALGMVTVTVRGTTSLIDVTVTGRDPEQVADLANGIAKNATTVLPGLEGQSKTKAPVRLERMDTALTPQAVVSPNRNQVLALGLIVGLALGLAVTIATQTLSTRLRRPEDVQRIFGRQLLASVPRLSRGQRGSVVVAERINGRAREAYRSLRTNLAHLDFEERSSVLVAPALPDRDGAQVPVNLAWSLAQAGRQVLLVDLDLRRSPVADLLGIDGGPGLADLLVPGGLSTADVVRPTDLELFHVIAAGQVPAYFDPSDLLSRPRLGDLVRTWEAEYDYVILNAPPLVTHTDGAVVAREAGWTLVTVRVGHTREQDLEEALGTLEHVRVEPLGLVVTGTHGASRDNRRIRGGRARSAAVRPAAEQAAVPAPAEPVSAQSVARPTGTAPIGDDAAASDEGPDRGPTGAPAAKTQQRAGSVSRR